MKRYIRHLQKIKQPLTALLVLPALLLAACPMGDEAGGRTEADWSPTATLFMLAGEYTGNSGDPVQNVKLSWQKLEGAGYYRVYRNGLYVASAPGDTWDDYGLSPGETYRYHVEAWMNNSLHGDHLITKSGETTVTPFTTTEAPQGVKDNFVSSSGFGSPPSSGPKPSGFEFEGKYYQYNTRGYGTAGTDQRLVVFEQVSDDGLDFVNIGDYTTDLDTLIESIGAADDYTPRTYPPPPPVPAEKYAETAGELTLGGKTVRIVNILPDTGLEGTGFFKYGDRVIHQGHCKEAGGYGRSAFFLAYIRPGQDSAFTVTFDERPMGNPSRDHSLFTDYPGTPNEKHYLISASNSDTCIYEFDENWGYIIRQINRIFAGKSRETPSILHRGGSYFCFSSRQSGWLPSQAQYGVASSLDGRWSELLNIGNSATCGAQFNHVAAGGTDRETFVINSYRWAANWPNSAKENANYVRSMTLEFSGNFAAAEYFQRIAFYPAHGYVGIQNGRFLSLGKPVKVTDSTGTDTYTNSWVVTDGFDMVDNKGRFTHATPVEIVVDLETSATIKETTLITYMMGGSEGAFHYIVSGSIDGETFTVLVDHSDTDKNWAPGFVSDTYSGTTPYRYVKLNVTGITNVNNSSGISSWASGIYEFVVYGNPQEEP
jgi:hypothetical protein